MQSGRVSRDLPRPPLPDCSEDHRTAICVEYMLGDAPQRLNVPRGAIVPGYVPRFDALHQRLRHVQQGARRRIGVVHEPRNPRGMG